MLIEIGKIEAPEYRKIDGVEDTAYIYAEMDVSSDAPVDGGIFFYLSPIKLSRDDVPSSQYLVSAFEDGEYTDTDYNGLRYIRFDDKVRDIEAFLENGIIDAYLDEHFTPGLDDITVNDEYFSYSDETYSAPDANWRIMRYDSGKHLGSDPIYADGEEEVFWQLALREAKANKM